jgi:hypothetical protein
MHQGFPTSTYNLVSIYSLLYQYNILHYEIFILTSIHASRHHISFVISKCLNFQFTFDFMLKKLRILTHLAEGIKAQKHTHMHQLAFISLPNNSTYISTYYIHFYTSSSISQYNITDWPGHYVYNTGFVCLYSPSFLKF